ncbi:hypothetical protein P152DRAFT_73235 [Eremomyces bilateralis CBS 781.70]|uniref:non-specific serine/threonine protein kinase n=1 Tax=Eremomyces bilateralis CBS 781.70 TaxID=1392243 RepID=A0A6G1FYX1_9PEZI|nr:uncharacterized protein P152DRAFT_73235 [Eremomyces bilateralis CBS 781.70]KAF1810984.1 hypothetical protein P152DRAFT_73235 [Eremomyces bilateralis CBS 781.70]
MKHAADAHSQLTIMAQGSNSDPHTRYERAVTEFHDVVNDERVNGVVGHESGLEDVNSWWVPESTLSKHFDERRLVAIGHELFPTRRPLDLQTRAIKRSYLKCFAILLYNNNGTYIEHFCVYESLSDSHLPFQTKPAHWPLNLDFKKFVESQWHFCPPKIEYWSSRKYESNRIFPIIDAKPIGQQHGSSRTHQITIHPEYNLLPSSTEDNQFVLKSFNTPSERFSVEVDAFINIRCSNAYREELIIGFYGAFVHGPTYHLILEYANGGTLKNYFEEHASLSKEHEIFQFWEALLPLTRALRVLHCLEFKDKTTHCIHHQDVKPENILVCKRDGKLLFKLADLGLSRIQRDEDDVVGYSGTVTRTYGPPECYNPDQVAYAQPLEVSKSTDIWSLGCIFSEAAVWVVRGPNGLREYTALRKEQTSKCHIEESDCFHDGKGVLDIVRKTHLDLGQEIRRSDKITLDALEVVEDMLLPSERRQSAAILWNAFSRILEDGRGSHRDSPFSTSPRSRTTPWSSLPVSPHTPTRQAAVLDDRDLLPDSHDNGASNGGSQYKPGSRMKDENHDSIYRTRDGIEMDRPPLSPDGVYTRRVSGFSATSPILKTSPTRERYSQVYPDTQMQGLHLDGNGQSEGNQLQFGPKLGWRGRNMATSNIDSQRNRRPKLNLFATDAAVAPSRRPTGRDTRAPFQLPPEGDEPSEEKSSVGGRSKRNSKEPSGTNFDHKPPFLPVKEARKWRKKQKVRLMKLSQAKEVLPHLQTFESKLEKRDHVFLIDTSSSMKPHWQDVEKCLDVLGYIVKPYDPDGLDLCFTSTLDVIHKRHSTSLLSAVRAKEPKKGHYPSDIRHRLGQILNEFLKKLRTAVDAHNEDSVRPRTIYVFTDGDWPEKYNPEPPIVEFVSALRKQKGFFGLQFIQFGDSSRGTDRLKRLDRLNWHYKNRGVEQ